MQPIVSRCMAKFLFSSAFRVWAKLSSSQSSSLLSERSCPTTRLRLSHSRKQRPRRQKMVLRNGGPAEARQTKEKHNEGPGPLLHVVVSVQGVKRKEHKTSQMKKGHRGLRTTKTPSSRGSLLGHPGWSKRIADATWLHLRWGLPGPATQLSQRCLWCPGPSTIGIVHMLAG